MSESAKRIAMIGARGHWNIVTRELASLPRLQVVGVSPGGADDPVTGILEACAKAGQQPPVFEDWERMLEETRPDIAVVCAKFEDHARQAVAAMDRKIHVVAEKLVALTMPQLAELEAAVQRNPGIHLAGMMQLRYDAGFYTAWKLAQQGAIGDVRLVNSRKSYRLGKRPAYYADRATYGGTIPWVGSHALDWILFVAGNDVRTVHAMHSAAHNGGNGTMERSAVVSLSLGNGRLASASIDVFRPDQALHHGDDWIRVVGTDGILQAWHGKLTLVNNENRQETEVPVSCDRTFMGDFLDQIDGVRPAILSLEDTIELTRACLLARESADTGKVMSF